MVATFHSSFSEQRYYMYDRLRSTHDRPTEAEVLALLASPQHNRVWQTLNASGLFKARTHSSALTEVTEPVASKISPQ